MWAMASLSEKTAPRPARPRDGSHQHPQCHLRRFPYTPDLVVIDTSFISLRLVLPAVIAKSPRQDADIVALVKPQFEVGKGKVGKGGVVRDDALRKDALDSSSHSRASPASRSWAQSNRRFTVRPATSNISR